MLYGQFPFYDNVPQELFNKIKAADYTIPDDGRVSEDTRNLIRRLLVTDPAKRLTASQVKQNVENIIIMWRNISPPSHNLQVVPQMPKKQAEPRKPSDFVPDNLMLNIPLQREFISEKSRKVSKAHRSGASGQIPVHKLGEDARPLTAEEYRMYSNVISQMRGVRSKHTRQAVSQNQVLVRSDRLHVYQPEVARPANLSDPSAINSLPATVPDHTEVLDLSQGSRRGGEGSSSRNSHPPYLGQGLPAPTHSRPIVGNRSSTNSALSLVGALRRLGTRVNLVPITESNSSLRTSGGSTSRSGHASSSHGSGGHGSSSRSSRRSHRHHHNRHHHSSATAAASSSNSQFIDLRHQSRGGSAANIAAAAEQVASMLNSAAGLNHHQSRVGVVPPPTPVPPPGGANMVVGQATPILELPEVGGVAMGLGEATRLLGISLQPMAHAQAQARVSDNGDSHDRVVDQGRDASINNAGDGQGLDEN
jgi:hypothetical protein